MTVFVPLTSLMPWSNCPNSFAKDISQIFLYGTLIRCLYSWATPETWWVTEFSSRVFWHCAVNAYHGRGFFLPLDFKLELGTPFSTVGGCALITFVGGIGTSGGMMLYPDVDMWTLCWLFVGFFSSSSSMRLGCTAIIYVVHHGCSLWGIMEAICYGCWCGGSALLSTLLAALVNNLESFSIVTIWEWPML